MDDNAPVPRDTRPRLVRRSVRLGVLAMLVALVPLIALAKLTTARAEDAVRGEVGARLRLTTAMSSSLLAEQLSGVVGLVEADAMRPRLIRAVAGGDPSRFDNAEVDRELAELAASPVGLAGAGLADLNGFLRGSPNSPELVGRDYSARDWYRGVRAKGDTYVSEAFESTQEGHPLALTASAFESDQRRCRDAGMDEHLAKPIQTGALAQTLRRLIRTTTLANATTS